MTSSGVTVKKTNGMQLRNMAWSQEKEEAGHNHIMLWKPICPGKANVLWILNSPRMNELFDDCLHVAKEKSEPHKCIELELTYLTYNIFLIWPLWF